MENHGLGMVSDKICEDSTTKNNPNTPQLIRPICPNQPKHLGYPYWVSVVRASEAVRFLDLLIWS